MSRPWRIEYEGALYHLLSRGNEGKDIFDDDRDRKIFLKTVGEMSERFAMSVYAYVLMGNHYHLVVKTERANLKKAMHWFGTTYTQRFNFRHSHKGHLFQGRYKSILVQNDAYLLQLSCYIHRNPLRAGIVKRLADYRWSSYLAYAYGRKAPKWLQTDLILSQFDSEDPNKSYREKVQRYAGEEERLWEDLRHGLILGSQRFVEEIRKEFLPSEPKPAVTQQVEVAKHHNPIYIVRKAEKILRCNVKDFLKAARVSGAEKETRDSMIYLIWKTGILTNDQIGQLFGLSYSAVSHAVKSLKARMSENQELTARLDSLYSQFKL
ncbi:MAG: transposase [Desulfobacterales bacterium]|jgi:REP element-mobilizing transposase RayT